MNKVLDFLSKVFAAVRDPKTGGLSVSRLSGVGLLTAAVELAHSGGDPVVIAILAGAGVLSIVFRTKTTEVA